MDRHDAGILGQLAILVVGAFGIGVFIGALAGRLLWH